MQPHVTSSEKARRLARPMSSFSNKDVTLDEVCPSVLGEHTGQPTMQSHVSVGGHATMKVSAPRRVYSVFEDTNDSNTDHSSTCFASVSAASGQQSHAEVPQKRFEPIGGHSVTGAAACDDSDPLSTGRIRVQFDNSRNEVTEYSPSAQGTPSHALAAAWYSVPSMSSTQGSEAFEGPNPIAGERSELSPSPPSRCASNLALRAGTFDELVDDLFVPKYGGPQGSTLLQQSDSTGFLSIRTNSGIPATADPQISRRASNMNNRAGTFNELVSGPDPSVPGASTVLIDDVQPLIDINSSLESFHPAYNASVVGVSGGLALMGSREEPTGLDGSISRRYTNMCNAAGAFDELVDDDGDVLSSSESESADADNSSHAPTISFSGMLSGMPAGNVQECSASAPVHGMRWQFMGPQNPHRSLGMIPATVDAAGIGGVLPSDLCSEASDGGQQNPLLMDSNDKSDAMRQFYLKADAVNGAQDPSMLGKWFDDLGGEQSDRSLRLTEIRTGSRNPSRGSSAAPPSSRRTALCDSMPVAAEHSTLSHTLSSALSIRTPRTVLQKFSQDDSEQLVSVLSTQEAYARVVSKQFAPHDLKHGASGFHTSDAENAPRMIPQQLQVVLPPEQEASGLEQAVLTPQEWLNKISKNVPSFPGAHMQLRGSGKAGVVSPDDSNTMSSRLGAFRPEEASLL